jgi:hypothetical protein
MTTKTRGARALFSRALTLLAALALWMPAAARADAPIYRVERRIPNEYIVVFEEGRDVAQMMVQMERWSGARALLSFGSVLPGGSFQMTDAQALQAAKMPGVAYLEENSVVYRIPQAGPAPGRSATTAAARTLRPLQAQRGAAVPTGAAAKGPSFGICGIRAKVVSAQELSTFGTGSRVISSELDPRQVRLNSFQTLVTLQILDAYRIDGEVECARMKASEKPQKFLAATRPEAMGPGSELELMWEYSIELTPDGEVYQERWSRAAPQR